MLIKKVNKGVIRVEKVKELFDLAMKVNEETEHDIFINISPHVKTLYLDIHYWGWSRGVPSDLEYRYSYKNDTITMHDEVYTLGKYIDYAEVKETLNGILRGDADV